MKNLITLLVLLVTNLIAYSQLDMVEFSYENNKKIVKNINLDSLELVLVQKINTFRVENGLSVLSIDKSLSKYSKNWTLTMSQKKTLNHSRIENSNIIAENVFSTISFGVFPMEKEYINDVANRIFKGWCSSTNHKNNMLNKDVSNIGVSIILIPNGMIDEYSTMVVN